MLIPSMNLKSLIFKVNSFHSSDSAVAAMMASGMKAVAFTVVFNQADCQFGNCITEMHDGQGVYFFLYLIQFSFVENSIIQLHHSYGTNADIINAYMLYFLNYFFIVLKCLNQHIGIA
jgi:hypothetical protein